MSRRPITLPALLLLGTLVAVSAACRNEEETTSVEELNSSTAADTGAIRDTAVDTISTVDPTMTATSTGSPATTTDLTTTITGTITPTTTVTTTAVGTPP